MFYDCFFAEQTKNGHGSMPWPSGEEPSGTHFRGLSFSCLPVCQQIPRNTRIWRSAFSFIPAVIAVFSSK